MKLYWRLKKNGRWTWRPVKVRRIERCTEQLDIAYIEREEEE